jgi:hypothetical protein
MRLSSLTFFIFFAAVLFSACIPSSAFCRHGEDIAQGTQVKDEELTGTYTLKYYLDKTVDDARTPKLTLSQDHAFTFLGDPVWMFDRDPFGKTKPNLDKHEVSSGTWKNYGFQNKNDTIYRLGFQRQNEGFSMRVTRKDKELRLVNVIGDPDGCRSAIFVKE